MGLSLVAAVWEALAVRLRNIPEYVDICAEVYDRVVLPEDVTHGHAPNAIAVLEGVAWRANNSPFGRFLASDRTWQG